MGAVVADLSQCLVGILDDRREFPRADRRDLLHLIGDLLGIGNDYLLRLFASKVRKFLQHLLGGPEVQRRLIVRIVKSFSAHDDPTVNFVTGIHKMHVAGRHHRLFELFAQPDDLPVQLLQILCTAHRRHIVTVDHKRIVAQGLDLQIIIKLHQTGNFRVRRPAQQRLVKLSRLAGGADHHAFLVFQIHALWQPRTAVIVFQMRL